MKKILLLLLTFSAFFAGDTRAQVSFNEDFDIASAGWTGSVFRFTGATTCGGAMRRNLYGSVPTANLVSPNTGTTAGGIIALSYDYKVANWSANTAGTANPWGSFNVQYGPSATGPWTTVETIDASNHIVSGTCTTAVVSFTPPLGSDLYIKWDCFRTGGDFYINFDNVNIVEGPPASCIPPIALSAVPTPFGVTMDWTENNSATSWDIAFAPGAGPSNPITVAIPNITTKPYVLPAGLSPNSPYHFYVRSICGPMDSSGWAGPFAFTTPPTCIAPSAGTITAITTTTSILGWTDNTTSGPSMGWQVVNQLVGGPYVASDSTYQAAATPTTSSMTGLTPNSNYEFYVRAVCGSGDSSAWAGPFSYSTPPTCLAPSAGTISAITATSSTLGWTDNTASGPTMGWQVVNQLIGGPFVAGDSTYQAAPTPTTASMTGLTSNSNYEFYVRAICATGDSSAWAGPFAYSTPCVPLVPTTAVCEDFVSMTGTAVPSCWSEGNGGTPASIPTVIGASDWTNDVFGNTAPAAAKINIYSIFHEDWIISPEYDMAAIGGPFRVKFDFGIWTWNQTTPAQLGSDDEIEFLVSIDNGATWTNLKTWTSSSPLTAAAGDNEVFNLNAYTTGTVKFAFYATGGTVNDANDNDVMLTNFCVEPIPTCPAPNAGTITAITATSSTLGWTDNTASGPALGWQVVNQLVGGPYVAGDTTYQATATPTSSNMTGLTPSSNYEFYVRAVCAVGDSSAWAGPFSYSTLATCLAPSAGTITAITSTSSTLGWTDNTVSGPALGWQVVNQLVGGPYVAGDTTYQATATPTSASMTGLTANTNYEFYVRAVCGAADSSAWVGPFSYTTLCSAISLAQFNIDGQFETGVLPSCWTVNAVATDNWKFIGTPGNPAMTALTNHTTGTTPSSTNVAFLDGSCSVVQGDSMSLTSPAIANADIVALTNPLLTFQLSAFNVTGNPGNDPASNMDFVCQLSYDNGASYVDVVHSNSNLIQNDWVRFSAELDKTALGANDLFVRFEVRALNGGCNTGALTYFNDHVIDDVSITDSTCASIATGIATTNIAANCGCTDLAGWTHYINEGATTSELLLSIQKTAVNDPAIVPSMVFVQGAATGATNVQPTAANPPGYVTTTYYAVMNRFWDVNVDNASRQSASATPVRFYYNTTDFTDLQTTITGLGGTLANHTDMVAYKIDNDKDPNPVNGHATVMPTDYNEYYNAATASTTDWAYATFGTAHQIELQVNSFSGGGGGFGPSNQNGALPVSLTKFTVNKEGSASIALWATQSEHNNSHFNLQRSLDGNVFTTLGKVNSKAVNGSSTVELNYDFTDKAPQIGHNYYRLEQVDQDGNLSYSQIVDLVWGSNGSVVSIYPNPAKDVLNIDIAANELSQTEIKLLDMSGRVVKSLIQHTQKGMNNISLNLSDVATGVYGVQIYENNKLSYVGKVYKN